MMVALRAFQAHAEEELAEHRREFRWLTPVAIDDGRPIAMAVPFRQHDFARELVVRLVRAKALAQPLIEQVNTFYADAIRIWAQQIGPFVGPEIRERGMRHNPLDQLFALLRIGVVEK